MITDKETLKALKDMNYLEVFKQGKAEEQKRILEIIEKLNKKYPSQAQGQGIHWFNEFHNAIRKIQEDKQWEDRHIKSIPTLSGKEANKFAKKMLNVESKIYKPSAKIVGHNISEATKEMIKGINKYKEQGRQEALKEIGGKK